MKLYGVIASMGLLGVASGQSVEEMGVAMPPPSSGTLSVNFSRLMNQDQFHALFPDANKLYNFDALVTATNKFPSFATSANDAYDRIELAAFLAQTAYQSDSFKATEEYAKDNYPVEQYCNNTKHPCPSGHRYHGRGAIQLSWNYNYYLAGEALGIDLLNDPDLVARDEVVAWATALWVWMTPHEDNRLIHDVITMKGGFAQSTDIVTGGLECGPDAPNKKNEEKRISYFVKMCDALDVNPWGVTSCNA